MGERHEERAAANVLKKAVVVREERLAKIRKMKDSDSDEQNRESCYPPPREFAGS